MNSILNISDGAVISLHAAALLARSPGLRPAQDIAAQLGVSYNHLAKVLQQLTRAGLLTPARGPKGGFALSAAGAGARVRDFVSAIDGPPKLAPCLMKASICRGNCCLLGDFLKDTVSRFGAVLDLKISEFNGCGQVSSQNT